MTHAMMSRLLVVFWLALCPAPTAPLGTATAAQAPVTITLTLPRKDGSVRFAVMGDTGTGDARAVRGGAADGRVPRRVPLRFRDHAGRQHHRVGHPCGDADQVRDALQAAPRRRSRVPRGPRQPRQPDRAFLQALQHGRRALLHLPGVRGRDGKAGRRWRALLRPRHRLPGQAAARLAGGGAVVLELGLEDRVLPSPPVLVRQHPRIRARIEGDPRAPLRQVRRERRLLRARPRLRAHQAPEGRHRLLGVRRRWPAAQGGHPRHGHDRQGVRQRLPLHDRGDRRRRPVLPGDQPDRRDDRQRSGPPARRAARPARPCRLRLAVSPAGTSRHPRRHPGDEASPNARPTAGSAGRRSGPASP